MQCELLQVMFNTIAGHLMSTLDIVASTANQERRNLNSTQRWGSLRCAKLIYIDKVGLKYKLPCALIDYAVSMPPQRPFCFELFVITGMLGNYPDYIRTNILAERDTLARTVEYLCCSVQVPSSSHVTYMSPHRLAFSHHMLLVFDPTT